MTQPFAKIEYGEALDWYDGPLLFDAKDAQGRDYIGVLADTRDDVGWVYTLVRVTGEGLADFKAGKLDLHDLYTHHADPAWAITHFNQVDAEGHMPIEMQQGTVLESPYRPEHGSFLHSASAREPQPEPEPPEMTRERAEEILEK